VLQCWCEQLYQLRESKTRQPSTDDGRLTKTGSLESQKERQQSIKVLSPVC